MYIEDKVWGYRLRGLNDSFGVFTNKGEYVGQIKRNLVGTWSNSEVNKTFKTKEDALQNLINRI